MARYKADPVGEKLARLMGIEPKKIRRIDIHIVAGGVLTATVEYYPDEKEVEYFLSVIDGAEVLNGETDK